MCWSIFLLPLPTDAWCLVFSYPFGVEFCAQKAIIIYFNSTCSYPVSTHYLLKMLPFHLKCVLLASLSKIRWPQEYVPILCQPNVGFVTITWNRDRVAICSIFYHSGFFSYPGSFEFLYEFWDYFSNFCEELHCKYDDDSTESVDCSWWDVYFHNINLSNHEHRRLFLCWIFNVKISLNMSFVSLDIF